MQGKWTYNDWILFPLMSILIAIFSCSLIDDRLIEIHYHNIGIRFQVQLICFLNKYCLNIKYIGKSEYDSVSQEPVRVCDKDTELEFSSSTFPHITGSLSLLQAHDHYRQTSCWPKHTIRLRIKYILHMWRLTFNLRIYRPQFYLFIRLLLPVWVRCPRLFPDECQWLKVWMLFFPIQEDACSEGNIDWTNCVIPNVCSFNIRLFSLRCQPRTGKYQRRKKSAKKQAFNNPWYIVSITLLIQIWRSEKPASLSSYRGKT